MAHLPDNTPCLCLKKQKLITARMVEVKQLIASTKNKTPGQELQPKEVIATNAQIREHMRQLNDDYKDLERLYQKEKSKRKVRKGYTNDYLCFKPDVSLTRCV